MNKKEKAVVRRCVGRVELLARLNLLQDATNQIHDLANDLKETDLLSVCSTVNVAIKQVEAICQKWIDEYQKLIGGER